MKRKLALFMVLAMLISLVPMNVFAGSTNTVNAVPTVKVDEAGSAVLSFEEKVATDYTTATTFKLTLHNADIDSVVATALTAVVTTADNQAIISLTGLSNAVTDIAKVTVNYTVTESANVTVDIDSMDSGLTAQDGIVIAKGAEGATKTTVSSVKTMGEAAQVLGVITIEETASATVTTDDVVKFRLPANFTWTTNPVVQVYGGITSASVTSVVGDRDLTVKVVDGSGANRGGIVLSASAITPGSDAKYGEVNVGVSSVIGDWTNETIKVADYKGFGVTVELDKTTVPTLYSGTYSSPNDDDTKLQKIVIKEDVANSMVSGRKMKIAFPDGVKIMGYDFTKGDNITEPTDVANYTAEDSSELEFTVTGLGGGKVEMNVVFWVSVSADYEGDITATVTGKALDSEYKVVAGKAVKKLAYTAVTKDVKLGLQKQAMGDIVITEPAAGVWEDGKVIAINIPTDFDVDTLPTFKVTKGDVEIKSAKENNSGDLEFTIDSESSVASEITISGGTVKLNRYLPEGDYKVNVGGGAAGYLIENYLDPADNAKFDVDGVGSVVAFRVITPADADTKTGEKVVFTIDAMDYMVGTAKVTSDVAPYINEQGRTMLPLRAFANALNVANDNIVWNEADRSVVIFKGDATIKVIIGEMKFTKNGTEVGMDTMAVIKNSRTMLPLRAVAQALGATIVWDEATRTVTIN